MIDPQLAGRVALVTGANNREGIGVAVARALAAQGVSVCLHYFRRDLTDEQGARPNSAEQASQGRPGEAHYWSLQQHSAEDIVAELRATGANATCIEADLRDATSVPRILDHAESELGPVDILINNAAASDADTFVPHPLGEGQRAVDGFAMGSVTPDSIDAVFAINSRAAALLIAEMARRHAERDADWGRVVCVSTDGASGFRTQVSYGASKHALESFSRAAAGELGHLGITVNTVSLGPIQTGWITADQEAEIAAATPLGRVGQGDDVADVVVFLCSEQARWLSGQLLYVGGGNQMPL